MEWYLAAFELHFCHFHFIGKVNNSTTTLSEDKPRTHYIFFRNIFNGFVDSASLWTEQLQSGWKSWHFVKCNDDIGFGHKLQSKLWLMLKMRIVYSLSGTAN